MKRFKIDRCVYETTTEILTEDNLRTIANIPLDREIWLIRPGRCDIRLEKNESLKINDFQRFFTAPTYINNSDTCDNLVIWKGIPICPACHAELSIGN